MMKQKKSADKKTQQTGESALELTMALGRELRLLREQKGLSIKEVAARLKLPARQIETLEQGQYAGLPEPVFVRGFLRSYGRFLDMNELRLNEYLANISPITQAYQQNKRKGGVNYSNTRVKKAFPKWIFGVLALAALAAGVYAWQMKSADETAKQESQISQNVANPSEENVNGNNVLVKPMTASDTATETVTATTPSSAHSATPQVGNAASNVPAVMGVAGELVVTPKYRTMLTVTDIGGKVLMNTIVPANSEHRFKEGAPFDVRIGYAVGAVASFNGQAIDLDAKRKGGKSVSFTAGEAAPAQ